MTSYTRKAKIYHYRSQNVCSQHPICVLVADDLHQSICISIRLGSAVGREGEFAHFIWHTLENGQLYAILGGNV